MDILRILSCILLGPTAVLILLRTVFINLPPIPPEARSKSPITCDLPTAVLQAICAKPYGSRRSTLSDHWTVTGLFNGYSVQTPSDAGFRAGTIAIIDLVPLLAAPHLSFAAGLLGLTFSSY